MIGRAPSARLGCDGEEGWAPCWVEIQAILRFEKLDVRVLRMNHDVSSEKAIKPMHIPRLYSRSSERVLRS